MKADIISYRDNALKAARRIHNTMSAHAMEVNAVVPIEEFDQLANDVELMNAKADMLTPREAAEMVAIINTLPYVSISCRKG